MHTKSRKLTIIITNTQATHIQKETKTHNGKTFLKFVFGR